MIMEYQRHISTVRQATREYVELHARTGATLIWPELAADDIARRLGDPSAGPRLMGQVKRSLAEMSAKSASEAERDAKELVEISGPNGRDTRYVPTDHALKRVDEAKRLDAQRAKVHEQWARINEALGDAGYITFGAAGEPPNLTLATWTRLAEHVTGLDLTPIDPNGDPA